MAPRLRDPMQDTGQILPVLPCPALGRRSRYLAAGVPGHYTQATDPGRGTMTVHPATIGPGTRRAGLYALLIVLIIAVIAAGSWWLRTGRHQASPWVVEGYALTNSSATAMSLRDTNVRRFNTEGLKLGGVLWRINDGPWNERGSCLKPLETRRHVRVGVVETPGGPSRYLLAWVQCLD